MSLHATPGPSARRIKVPRPPIPSTAVRASDTSCCGGGYFGVAAVPSEPVQLSAGNLDEALESYRGLVAATGQSDTQDLYLGVPRSRPVPIPVHPAAPRPVKKEEPWSVTLAEQGKAAARMIEEGERSRARRYGKKKQGQSPRAVKVESIVAAEPFQFLEVSPPPTFQNSPMMRVFSGAFEK